MEEKIVPEKKDPGFLRRCLYLSIPFIVFLLVLLGIEGFVRLTKPHISSLEALLTRDNFMQPNEERLRAYEGDPLLGWRLKPNLKDCFWDYTTFSTNNEGFRHDGPIRRKDGRTTRIVCLGDSVTFGYRVPLSFQEDGRNYFDPAYEPYPQQLQKILQGPNPGRNVEVITMAVPGYSSHQGLAWLRQKIERLNADLYIICFGWNDEELKSVSDRVNFPLNPVRVLAKRILIHSQAMIYLSKWIDSRRQRPAGTPSPALVPRLSVREYVDNFRKMARLIRRNGGRVLVLGSVYRDPVTNPDECARMTRYREALAAGMKEEGVPYLEIEKLTERGYPGNKDLFDVSIMHLNVAGFRIMAERIADFLKTNGAFHDLPLVF